MLKVNAHGDVASLVKWLKKGKKKRRNQYSSHIDIVLILTAKKSKMALINTLIAGLHEVSRMFQQNLKTAKTLMESRRNFHTTILNIAVFNS